MFVFVHQDLGWGATHAHFHFQGCSIVTVLCQVRVSVSLRVFWGECVSRDAQLVCGVIVRRG
jgi:hypothetical protein